ncbi:hypothetical protein DP0503 [Desulfotalea psychrophila LSv54]|uniref:DUF547 domain-containing protein n=2 Tax=Desulfotalea psychrophila TaxID=84980 RepID=Q6AQZ2_DESPS|nr:hypothetical protein DP0503 [Desulfotalea psychrophila LSv54]
MEEVVMRSLLFVLFILVCPVVEAVAFDHGPWDSLLQEHVRVYQGGQETKVDYAAMARERPLLSAYLDQLSQVSRGQFDSWTKAGQLAFLINAYNAWTVELILSRYSNLQSIKELGSFFQSPWKKKFFSLLGQKRSLDDLEHGLIRGSGRYGDPRIHFALNCASIGCPALKDHAYQKDRLEGQLQEATTMFLADRRRNRLSGGKLQVSSIFKWYGQDFGAGWRGARTLSQFLALYSKSLGLSEAERHELLADRIEIDFLDYDWKLNGVDSDSSED